jgi:hypothetical protein
VTLLTGIVIAVISAWVTVQLSLRRFRTERWWERKVNAYERVITALYDAKASANQRQEAVIHNRELSEETQNGLSAKSMAARKETARAIEIGAFLLSNETLSRLQQYRQEEHSAYDVPIADWREAIDNEWFAIHDALRDLILLAKKDLQIYNYQTWRERLRLAATLPARAKRN